MMISRNADFRKLLSGVNSVISVHGKELRKNVIVVSNSFAEAALLCADKMIDNELYKDIGDNLKGILLFKNISVIYDVTRVNVNGYGAWGLNIIEFSPGNCLRTFVWQRIASFTDENNKNQTPTDAAKSIWHFVQLVLMFQKFAQVETKELAGGQKIKGIDCNYKNETKTDITYLTSTWFTNLVKSDAFKVRGHFRLQPCGQAFKDKKLIWINDFEKHGYTRQAGKLKEENELK